MIDPLRGLAVVADEVSLVFPLFVCEEENGIVAEGCCQG